MENINHHFLPSGARGWVWAGNACCPLWLWLWGPHRGTGRSPESSGHLQRQPGRHRSAKNLPQLSRLQAQMLLLPQMAVGTPRAPWPCLTLGSRDWSQLWHFYQCLRATLKTPYFSVSFPASWQMIPSSHLWQLCTTAPAWECPVLGLRIDASVK